MRFISNGSLNIDDFRRAVIVDEEEEEEEEVEDANP
jgi:hypothetical protein